MCDNSQPNITSIKQTFTKNNDVTQTYCHTVKRQDPSHSDIKQLQYHINLIHPPTHISTSLTVNDEQYCKTEYLFLLNTMNNVTWQSWCLSCDNGSLGSNFMTIFHNNWVQFADLYSIRHMEKIEK